MAPRKLTTMYLIKAFFRRIIKDFRQKELLPLKLLFFMHASTLFVLYPYLTIHMRELGINVEETAIMSAVTPVVAIIMPPLAGMVADRIGNFKILLAAFSALGGGVSLLLLLVPVGRYTITYPENLTLSLGCGATPRNILELRSMEHQDSLCHVLPALGNHKVAMHEISCGFECEPDLLAGGPKAPGYFLREGNGSMILGAREYDVTLDKVDGDKSPGVTFSFSMPSPDILKFGADRYYFPTPGLFRPSCETVEPGNAYRCKLGSRWQENAGMFRAARLLPLKGSKFLMTELTNWTSGAWDRMVHNATCANTFIEEGEKVSVSIGEGAVRLMGCEPRCLMSVPRRRVCSNLKKQIEYDITLTFWSYLVVRVLIGIIGGTAFAMFEGAVIAILREQNADYGLQRIYATIGGMISSPLSGMLIDWASKGKGYTDFRPAFYLYAALKIVSGLLMLTINLEFKAPATNVVSDVISVLKNVEIVALFIAIFVLGTAWGYLESFLFWLLQDLGGSRSLMGITITVGGVAGIPLLVLSGPIIDRIGHANVLFIGFMFYAIRLLGYSLIYNPWLCLIFEAMESVTSSLSFTAAVTYAAKLSTTTTDTSIQGLLGGLYFGVGKGAGSLIGGYIMKGFGTRPTYRVFAVACTITGITYFLFNKFYLRKRPQVEGNDIVKKKPPITVMSDMIEIDLKNPANNNLSVAKKGEKEPINKNAKSYSSAATNQKDVPPPRPAIPPPSVNGNHILKEKNEPEENKAEEKAKEDDTHINNADGTCKINLAYEPDGDEQGEEKRTNRPQSNVEKEPENMGDAKENKDSL